MMNKDDILVSIRCAVYNHEPFLRQCLDGFVMQKTNFRFEAIVHDDASTDNSASIIREYASKYPDIIKPIYETENQYSKHDGSLSRIITAASQGKYYAVCEGDDYWTDPEKLQKQVDYLESNPDCSLIFTNALVKWVDHSHPDHLFADLDDRDYSGLEILEQWIIPTASVMYRKEIILSNDYTTVFSNKRIAVVGDTPFFMLCAKFGTLHAFHDATCVYRKHDGGFLLSADAKRKLQLGDHRLELYKVFGSEYESVSVLTALPHYRTGLWHARQEKNYQLFFVLIGRILKVYMLHPGICWTRIKHLLKEKH